MSLSFSARARAAARAFGLHFAISLLVALGAAILVMQVWYPYPYYLLSGGMVLFGIMMAVDVVCGPALTAVLYSPTKSARALAVDMGLVACIQLAALGYGLHALEQARPVALVFEADRFVAVSRVDVTQTSTAGAAVPLSWYQRPAVFGVRQPHDGQEKLHSILQALDGQDVSTRPDWWQPYADSIPAVKTRMQPATSLHARLTAQQQAALDAAVQKTALPIAQLHYLPLVAYKNLDGWVVLLNADADIVGYAPVPGFE